VLWFALIFPRSSLQQNRRAAVSGVVVKGRNPLGELVGN